VLVGFVLGTWELLGLGKYPLDGPKAGTSTQLCSGKWDKMLPERRHFEMGMRQKVERCSLQKVREYT
jgi:hypothetical protein